MTLTDLTVDSVLAAFGRRARQNGHPVTCVLPGRQPLPDGQRLDPDVTNDRLDLAAELARSMTDWAMVVLTDDHAVSRLADALVPNRRPVVIASGADAHPGCTDLTTLALQAVVSPYWLSGSGVLNVPLPLLDRAFPRQEVA